MALPLSATPPDRPLEDLAREQGLDPELLIWPWELGQNLSDWLSRLAVGRRPEERLQIAFHQLLADSGRGLEYDGSATGTADEVFASGRANCLGFSMLFVGIARELGVEADFLRVARQQSYRREGDLLYISEHVTAGYKSDGVPRMVQFNLGPELDYKLAREIDDLTAMALFYSNRGAEALRDGDAAEAVRWLEVAVRLDESEASSWTNLGVARRRLGQLDVAEAGYRHAIEIDPGHLAAYINLASVLRLRGESEAAREIVRLLDRNGNRNPYAYLALGDASLEENRLDDARRYYRRAVRFGGRDAEPRAAMGLWALSSGDRDSARKWLRRAQRYDRLEERTLRLERRLNQQFSNPGAAASAGGPEQPEREVES